MRRRCRIRATPRLAGLGEDGRPHLSASVLPLGMEVKHNRLICLQLTPSSELTLKHYK